jgi:FKBP-type peptidyl-prolyl cis-trans isomerase
LFLALVAAILLPACGSDNPTGPNGGDLVVEDIVVGTGATAVAGDVITVHYLGTFTSGQKFESSYDSGRPYTFRLGAGSVIPGWDLGIVGMKVGGKRRLTIPPNLAYGATGQGPIPGNTTIVFEVELLSIAGK